MAVEKIATVGDGNRSGDTVTRIYITRKGDAATLWGEYIHNESYPDGYFNRKASSINYGEAYATVTLAFGRYPDTSYSGGTGDFEDGDTEYNCNGSTMDKPLETLKNYKTRWNYDLYEYLKKGEQPIGGTPDWYWDATDRIIPAADFGKYQWAQNQPGPDAEGEWALAAARTKNAEAYKYPAPTISVVRYYHSRNKAFEQLQALGKLKAPGYTGPYLSGNEYWLVMDSTVQKTGRYWAVNTVHTYADEGWDEDFYTQPGGNN